MRLGVTGAEGFLGWHVRCAARAMTGVAPTPIGRQEFQDPELMDQTLSSVDSVIHLAGVNRGPGDDVIYESNVGLARALVEGIKRSRRKIPVTFANSVHRNSDTAFGHSKLDASSILAQARMQLGAFADVVLPNIFGEHGRPDYNSFVATFCAALARGQRPTVVDDRTIELLHAQRAAATLIECALSAKNGEFRPRGQSTTVVNVLSVLNDFAGAYVTGQYPNLGDPFIEDLFNTYRSFTFPSAFPIYPDAMTDPRGRLVEAVRASGGEAQIFFSSTRPGMTRGEHFHLRKVERFLVLRGSGRIQLRRLFSDEVHAFDVNGERPAIIDMPTMWAHSISNVGDSDLLTLFYANQCFNPQAPDTYPEKVRLP